MKSHHIWTKASLYLHWLMAICVVLQVSLILFREMIGHQNPRSISWSIYRTMAIQVHEYLGIIIFCLVLIFFINKKNWGDWYPFFSQEKFSKITQDLRCIFIEKKIPSRPQGGLAGLVQGLGLLLVFGLASLGTVAMICWLFPSNHLFAQIGHSLIQIHKFFAGLIFWYLGGHVGMAVLHKILPEKFHHVFL